MIENKRKWILKMFFLVLIIITLAYNVQSLGVAPSRHVVLYSNEEQTLSFRILNNDHKDMQIKIIADGELAKYITAEKTIYNIKGSDGETTVTYKFKLPQGLEPGTRSASIIALETSENSGTGETLLMSALGVSHQLKVEVPYPGKYIEGFLYISTGDVNSSIGITANLVNKGSETITNAQVELLIKGPTNEILYRGEPIIVKDLESQRSRKVETSWIANANPGMYIAEIVINYDGKTALLRNTFVIGQADLEISRLSVGPFKIGAVAEFNIDVINNWNQQVDNVYGELEIIDEKGNLLETVKTPNFNTMPMSTANTKAYWNTAGRDIGSYDVKVIMHYASKTSERLFKTVVGIDKITIQEGLVANIVASESKGSNTSLLVTLVIILVIVNIGWLIYFKFLKKKKDEIS